MGNTASLCHTNTPSEKIVEREMNRMYNTLKEQNVIKRLQEVDFFVLDNSIR